MKLIDYKNSFDCDVEFQDEYKYVFEHAVYNNFKQGKIGNPYDKTVYGVGMLGNGKYKARYNSDGMAKEYNCWLNMLERCYEKSDKHPAYYEISTVCKEWLNYQNFAKWYEENWYEIPNNKRMHVDKDILIPGNKVYSPETCVLVPQRINMLFSNKSNMSGLPNGIHLTDYGKYAASYNAEYLGCFNTVNEAYCVYAKKKESAIKKIADEYKKYIPAKLYDALYRYEVKIENDKNYIEKR